jgi:hypothetical protein
MEYTTAAADYKKTGHTRNETSRYELNIVAHLLKSGTVEPQECPLIRNGCITLNRGVIGGTGVRPHFKVRSNTSIAALRLVDGDKNGAQ